MMMLITNDNTIATKLNKTIAVGSEIFRVDDWVVEGESEGVGEVEPSTKFAGSINGARGVWLKLNEFIMSLAVLSRPPSVGRRKLTSASLRSEPNSYSVWSI